MRPRDSLRAAWGARRERDMRWDEGGQQAQPVLG